MTLRALVFIALRFYAVYYLAQLLTSISLIIAFWRQSNWALDEWGLSVPCGYLITAILLWFAAGPLASRIAREFNPPVQIDVTLESSLAFAFVFLGLYFVLSSTASAMIQLIQLIQIAGKVPQGDSVENKAAIDFFRPGVTFIVGFSSVICARSWARKLSKARPPSLQNAASD